MDYQKMWERLKEWVEQAVYEGHERGFDGEQGTIDSGLFYAYNRVLEEMKRMDGE